MSHPLKQKFIEQRLCNRHLRYMIWVIAEGGNSKGNLHHWNFQIWEYLWLDMTVEHNPLFCGRYNGTQIQYYRPKSLFLTYRIRIYWHSEWLWLYKARTVLWPSKECCFPLSFTQQVRCSTNMNRNEHAWTIYGINTPTMLLPPPPLWYRSSPSGSLAYFLFHVSLSCFSSKTVGIIHKNANLSLPPPPTLLYAFSFVPGSLTAEV